MEQTTKTRHKLLLIVMVLVMAAGMGAWELYQEQNLRELSARQPATSETSIVPPRHLTIADGLTVQGGQIALPKESLNGHVIASGTISGSQLAPASITAKSLSPEVMAAIRVGSQPQTTPTPNQLATTNPINRVITEKDIASDSLGPNVLKDNSVTSDKVADGSITAADIADGVITTHTIPDDSITSAKLVDGSIAASDIAEGAINADKLADRAVTGSKLATDSVSAVNIKDNSIAASDLEAGAVTGTQVANNTITTADIATSTVNSALIHDESVTGRDIAPASITAAELAADAVTSLTIVDGSITGADLADGTITSRQLGDGEVRIADLASEARRRTIAVQVGDITGNGKKEKPLFVAPTRGVVTKISVTNGASYSAASAKGSLSIERKSSPGATVGSIDLLTTSLAAFAPRSFALTSGMEFSAGDVYSFKSDVTGAGSSLSGLLVTIDYDITE